ncbi:hypothetical protein H0H93_002561 [Arthromyces matolae]|nr:hypothetical protein H0H93_002561 [Arthromyces matolae]
MFSSQFVKLDWLMEVIRLGTLAKDSPDISLEQNFELPPLNKYRPAFSTSLPTSQKEFRVWEPNEERLNIFSAYRFLWVDEKSRLGDYKDVIERGGGSFEAFDATAGKLKFHRALTRGQAKEGKTQIVVGKKKSIIAAIGQERWGELVEEAKSFGLSIIEPDLIVQVVIDTDTSLFQTTSSPEIDNDELSQSNSLPDFIPNTLSAEPSQPPPEPEQPTRPVKRLTRRATSRQPSQEPQSFQASSSAPTESQQDEHEEAPRPARKVLTRRVKPEGTPLVIGLDDPSMILDAPPGTGTTVSPPSQPAPEEVPATQKPRSSRLKRRVGVASAEESQPIGFISAEPEPSEEPPLKKFKALFEASGQENMGSTTFDGSTFGSTFDDTPQSIPDSSSQTQNDSQTQAGRRRIGRSGTANLSVLREEEEESQMSVAPTRGTKRALENIHEDAQMADVANEQTAGPSLAKKRAIENVNSVQQAPSTTAAPVSRAQSKPPSTAARKGSTAQKAGGASPGKPDQDDRFLKAIASTKKGKKGEDDFDRDFNKLKISKPTLEREDPEEAWAVVAEFGDDINIRGNFMMIVEMPVYHRGVKGNVGANDAQWQGKPNFKRFKKKPETVRSSRIELVASEENDYGMGTDEFGPTQTLDIQEPPPSQPIRSQAPMVIDSDEDIVPTRKSKSKASSRANSVVPPKRAPTRSKASAKSQSLFLEDDEDDDMQASNNGDEAPQDSDEEQTLRSTRTRSTQQSKTKAPKNQKKAVAPVLVDDDSDDEAVFKGFKGRQKRQ